MYIQRIGSILVVHFHEFLNFWNNYTNKLIISFRSSRCTGEKKLGTDWSEDIYMYVCPLRFLCDMTHPRGLVIVSPNATRRVASCEWNVSSNTLKNYLSRINPHNDYRLTVFLIYLVASIDNIF